MLPLVSEHVKVALTVPEKAVDTAGMISNLDIDGDSVAIGLLQVAVATEGNAHISNAPKENTTWLVKRRQRQRSPIRSLMRASAIPFRGLARDLQSLR
jgi:hypothetical protein